MSYELIGLNPQKAIGISIRFNNLKWVHIVKIVNLLKPKTINEMDAISRNFSLSQIQCVEIVEAINEIIEFGKKESIYNFDNGAIYKLIEQEIQRAINIEHGHGPENNEIAGYLLNNQDLFIFKEFLINSGGFAIA